MCPRTLPPKKNIPLPIFRAYPTIQSMDIISLSCAPYFLFLSLLDYPCFIHFSAGQECPGLSGIPRGLGAGFKLGSGDREREKDKEHKDKDRDQDTVEQEPEPLVEKRGPKSDEEPVPHTSGWTSVLEDFLVHGIPFVGHSAHTKDKGSQPDLGRSYSTGDIKRRPKTGTRGPYEILVKERLMGIYLAIFVHRDAKHLVRGASFSPTVRWNRANAWPIRHVQGRGHRRTYRWAGRQQRCCRN